uniref:Solute carrier family 22 member 18 n=1 Tax=Monodelphis domestica TaxID=13616 RepID=K7DZP2_MONDO
MIMFSIISMNFFELGAAQAGYLMSYFGVLQMVVQGLLIGRLSERYSEGSLLRASILVFSSVGLGMVRLLVPRLGLPRPPASSGRAEGHHLPLQAGSGAQSPKAERPALASSRYWPKGNLDVASLTSLTEGETEASEEHPHEQQQSVVEARPPFHAGPPLGPPPKPGARSQARESVFPPLSLPGGDGGLTPRHGFCSLGQPSYGQGSRECSGWARSATGQSVAHAHAELWPLWLPLEWGGGHPLRRPGLPPPPPPGP